MRFVLKATGLLIVVLVVVVVARTLGVSAPVTQVATPSLIEIDEAAAAGRLAEAVRIATVSFEDHAGIDATKLDDFAAFLAARFPKAHAAMKRETVDSHSLLYTWAGREAELPPALLLAHMDVVPVEAGTESAWTHAPFSGDIADGFVWGRGTLDDKGSLVGWMEAVEALAATGYVPKRTLVFAFGHDEEIGGEGATAMAALLKSRGFKAAFALDEGGVITRGVIPGVKKPVASIMAAEKGYVSFRLTARGEGGHSSIPPPETAAGKLARAVARVQDHPLPARLSPAIASMLERLSPEMPFVQRMAIANRWLFEPLLIRSLGASPVGNALLRTTTAPTVLRGGVKDNVLPTEAWALINFRLLPGDTVDDVERHLHDVIRDDGITITREGHGGNEASAVSDPDSPAFAAIERSIREVYPEVVVSSGIVVGTTDLRRYEGVFDNRYNFQPTPLAAVDLPRLHGINERIGVTDYARMIRFYARLIENIDALPAR